MLVKRIKKDEDTEVTIRTKDGYTRSFATLKGVR